MEKKVDGIFISNVFLESIKKSLLVHCRQCKDYLNCDSCKVEEVLDDLKFIEEFAGEDNE